MQGAHLFIRVVICAFLLLLAGLPVFGQTIWTENFTGYPNGTQNTGRWSTSFGDCDDAGPFDQEGAYWGVFNGRFRVNDIEGTACDGNRGNNDNRWISEVIDISNVGCVDLSVVVSTEGPLNCGFPAEPEFDPIPLFSGHDQLVVEYRLNGGGWNRFTNGYFCGPQGGTATANDLSGNTVQIRIRAGTQANGESYFFDNIRVTGTTSTYSLPTLGPFCSDEGIQSLPTTLNGVNGQWSGPGVSGNQFSPAAVGPGNHSLTFSPDDGTCALPQSLTVRVDATPQLASVPDQEVCDIFLLPPISGPEVPNNAAYFTMPNGGGVPLLPGDEISTSRQLYIFGSNGGCSGQESFSITVNPRPNIDPLPDQESCGTFTFPNISGTNLVDPAYYTQPDGQGLRYDPGAQIIRTAGIYSFFLFDQFQSCSSQQSFSLTVGSNAQLNTPADVDACSFYVLPPINGTDLRGPSGYSSLPDGQGSIWRPGDTLRQSGTYFLFDGTDECLIQDSFSLTIQPIPEFELPLQDSACDTYILPPLSGTQLTPAAGYFSSPDRAGTAFQAGDTIRSSQTIYLHDEISGCTQQDSLLLHLSLTPHIDRIVDTTFCDSLTLPPLTGTALVDPGYYTGPERTGRRWFPGDLLDTSQQLFVYDDNQGCIDRFAWHPRVQQVDIDLTILDTNLCADEALGSLLVNIRMGNGPFQFDWSADSLDGLAFAENLSAGSYRITVTDPIGCSDSAQQVITQPTPLSLDCNQVTPVSLPLGQDGQINASFSGGTGPYTLFLTGPIVDSAVVDVPDDYRFSGLIGGDYQVLLVDDNRCFTDCFFSVPTPPCPLEAEVELTPESCPGAQDGQIRLTTRQGRSPLQVSWQDGHTDSLRTGLTAGMYRYQVMDSLGCEVTDTIRLETAHDQPTVAMAVLTDTSNPCGPECDTVRLTVGGTPTFRFALDIAQGDTLVRRIDSLEATDNPTLTDIFLPVCASELGLTAPDSAITYTLVQFADAFCAVDTQIQIQRPAPVRDTSQLDTLICPDEQVLVGLTRYDKNRPSGLEILEGQNALGCDSIVEVSLSFFPTDTFLWQPTLCAGDTLTVGDTFFTMDQSTGLVRLPEADQNGCDSLIDVRVNYQPAARALLRDTLCHRDSIQIGGTWFTAQRPKGQVRLADSGQGGCDSLIEVDLTFRPPLQAFILPIDPVCAGDSTQVSIALSGGTSWQLAFDTAWTLAGRERNVRGELLTWRMAPRQSGQITLLRLENLETGCAVNNAAIREFVVSAPGVGINPTTDYLGFGVSCPGAKDGELAADVRGTPFPVTYQWSTSDRDSSILGNLAAGDYALTVTDALGCQANANIRLQAPPPISLSTEIPAPNCPGEYDGAIQLTSLFGGADSFYFYSLNQTGFQVLDPVPTTLATGLEPGRYNLEIRDGNDCTVGQEIVIPSPPDLRLVLPDQITVKWGDSIQLTPQMNFDAETVQWTAQPNLTIPNTLNPVIRPDESTTLRLTVQDADGCLVEATVDLIVDRRLQIYAPNVLRAGIMGPNGRFTLYNNQQIQEIVSLRILDRWGNLVFEARNIPPDTPSSGWDGTKNGAPLPTGTYMYTAQIRLVDGRLEQLSGDISLLK